jgi:hypothetical protein
MLQKMIQNNDICHHPADDVHKMSDGKATRFKNTRIGDPREVKPCPNAPHRLLLKGRQGEHPCPM